MGNQSFCPVVLICLFGLSAGCSSAPAEQAPAVAAEAAPATKELGSTLDGKVISLDNDVTQSALMEGIRARDVGQVHPGT